MATSIRLRPETERRLDFLATQTGRTKAFYLREIIERGIDDLEDHYLSAEVLEAVREARERTYARADVRRVLKDPRRAFVEQVARLRQRTAGRSHTPAEDLIGEDRRRRSGIDQ